MFKRIVDLYEEWKFNREFKKKKKELMTRDPFIYHIPSETEDYPGAEPTRFKTWESKGKEIDF